MVSAPQSSAPQPRHAAPRQHSRIWELQPTRALSIHTWSSLWRKSSARMSQAQASQWPASCHWSWICLYCREKRGIEVLEEARAGTSECLEERAGAGRCQRCRGSPSPG